MNRASIALGLGGGAVACALLAVPMVSALGDLWSARQTRADLAARIAEPPEPMRSLVAPGLALRAPDHATAARMIATRVRDSAGAAGVLVEAIVPTAPRSDIVTLRVRLSGPEKAVIALIDGIERGTPLTRFRAWRATALTDGGVRVEGELVAAWQ